MENGGLIVYLSQFSWFQGTLAAMSTAMGFDATALLSFLIYGAFATGLVLFVLMPVGGLATYAERKFRQTFRPE